MKFSFLDVVSPSLEEELVYLVKDNVFLVICLLVAELMFASVFVVVLMARKNRTRIEKSENSEVIEE